MATQIIRPKTHEDWLLHRASGIGSSEIGTILGVNPFDTPYQLWLRKTGKAPAIEETFAMKAGHYLEDAVARFWEDESGRNVVKSSAGDWLVCQADRPHLRVSPDRLYWLEGRKGERGILECKTTQRNVDADSIPKSWFCQVQYQLGTAEMRYGSLAWLISGRAFGYRDIAFNKEFYEWIIAEVEAFWYNNVLGGIEPLPISVEDVLLKYPTHAEGKSLETTEEVALACHRYNELKEQIAELEDRKAEAEKSIKMAFDDAESISYGGLTLATWKGSKPSEKVDVARLKADHPELVAQYIKQTSGTRRLSVK